MKIFKYPLPLLIDGFNAQTGPCTIEVPAGGKILSVGVQEGQIMVWCAVDPLEKLMSDRRLFVAGTGKNDIPDSPAPTRFLGTVQVGWFVGHVFEMP